HASVPIIGNHGKVRVKSCAQAAQQFRQRVFKVTILTLAETMPRHVDMTAKVLFLRIESRNLTAFIRVQKSFDHRAALTAQLFRNLRPVILRNTAITRLHSPVPSAAGCSCRRLFFLDDDLLALRAPAVAGKGAITSDHAMTRDRQGNCVGRAGVRDSTDRAWFANAGSERGVSNLVADPNPEQCGPNAPLEGGSSNIERQIEPLCWGFDKRQNLFEIGA